jgi:hypothetical protein
MGTAAAPIKENDKSPRHRLQVRDLPPPEEHLGLGLVTRRLRASFVAAHRKLSSRGCSLAYSYPEDAQVELTWERVEHPHPEGGRSGCVLVQHYAV